MREYELLYIVSGALSEVDATKAVDGISNTLTKLGGKAQEEKSKSVRPGFWGRRKLAYPIAKQDHGWFVISRFELAPEKVSEFEHGLRLNDQVLRTVLVKATEVPTPEEAERMREAAEKEGEEAPRSRAKPGAASGKPKVAVAPPETVAKTAKPAAKTPPAKAKPKPAAKPTAAESADRQKKLDEKLGEILKDE
jgi:small subunit ribosomal protein S6